MEKPFSLCQYIAGQLEHSFSNVHFHFTQVLEYKNARFCRISHMFNDELQSKIILKSQKLLKILELRNKIGFRDLITGDEKPNFLEYQPNSKWVSKFDPVPTKSKKTIQTLKQILTVFGKNRFAIIDWISFNQTMNSEYFCLNMLKTIAFKLRRKERATLKPFTLIHMYNARIHTAKKIQGEIINLRFKQCSLPPFSPNIAPSDFFLFGILKNILEKEAFENFDELHSRFKEILY